MTTTLPTSCAEDLGLKDSVVGDQIVITVEAVNADGSVSVSSTPEEAEPAPETPVPQALSNLPMPGPMPTMARA